jgi:hypothetical protein
MGIGTGLFREIAEFLTSHMPLLLRLPPAAFVRNRTRKAAAGAMRQVDEWR